MHEPEPPTGGPSSAASTVLGKVAVVVGLTALAVAQPLLDLMGRNPAFFVAGRYTSGQIVLFGLLVVALPAVVFTVLTVATTRLGRAGEVAYLVMLGALGALFGNIVTRGTDLDGGKVALIAAALGAGIVLVVHRFQAGRMLLQFLALGNVLFLFSFLLMGPTSELVMGGSAGDVGEVSLPELPGPVFVVVLDEMPLSVLMDGEGQLNAERYPAFAKLAATSTWYRNASSDHHRTERATPELVTGVQPAVDALPSYVDLPRNLLTLFADEVPVERYEAITDMCPPSACAARSSGSMRQMLEDASVVYGHRVLPARLRDDLPPIDQAWGAFGGGVGGDADAGEAPECKEEGRLKNYFCKSAEERSPPGQAAALAEIGAQISNEPALYFAHVVLPHQAYVLTPWGTSLMGAPPDQVTDPADPAYDWSRQLLYQRASLQFGAADAVLGDIFEQMEEIGAWDDATIVITSDHGTSLLPPDYGRDVVTDANREEVYRVPLIVKAPGQTEGRIVDDPASTLDILPTLIDLLDIETNWEFDGHSLLDGSEATVEPTVDPSLDPLFELVAQHLADVPGRSWDDLAKVGEHADLVGRSLADLPVGEPSALRWAADGQDSFGDLPTDTGAAPQVLNGSVVTPDGARPPELVVSVNGRIGGVVGGYSLKDSSWRFGTVLAPYLVDGANDIVAYEVGADGTLHPLP